MKPTIEQALANKLPLPWKQTTCDGPPAWAVERQRPADLTVGTYERLRRYGVKDDAIRELFFAGPGEWALIKQERGIVTKRGLAAWMSDDPRDLSKTPPAELKKITVGEPEQGEDENGLNYQDRHALGLDADPLAGWAEFSGEPHGHGTFTGMSVGKKFSLTSGCVPHFADWDFCKILVSPDASQIALKKSSSGVKLQRCKHTGRAMVCKAALRTINERRQGPLRYRLEAAQADVVMFRVEAAR